MQKEGAYFRVTTVLCQMFSFLHIVGEEPVPKEKRIDQIFWVQIKSATVEMMMTKATKAMTNCLVQVC